MTAFPGLGSLRAATSTVESISFVQFLFDWQTLVGGFLAVLAAIVSAVLLVGLQGHKTRASAARLIFYELVRFQHQGDAAVEAAQNSPAYHTVSSKEDPEITPDDVEAAILARSYPELSSVFEGAVRDLADGDPELALLLSIFQTYESLAEKMFSVYLRVEDRLLEDPEAGELSPYVLGYIRSGYKHYQSAREMIEELNNLIERLYLSRYSFFIRAKRWIIGMGGVLEKRQERLLNEDSAAPKVSSGQDE